VHLPAAVNYLPVREIRSFRAVSDPQTGIAVERQGDAELARALEQVWQEPGISPGGQQQVRVVALQDGAQVDQQGALRLQRQSIVESLEVNQKLVGR